MKMGLDGLEIIMGIEEAFGIVIPEAVPEKWITVRDVIDYVYKLMPQISPEECQTQKIFFKLRRGFRTQIPALVSDFGLKTKLKDVLHKDQWPRVWTAIRNQVGEEGWHESVSLDGFLTKHNIPATVKKFAGK
jgi:hypothetical protein